jgi:hypothetical protein
VSPLEILDLITDDIYPENAVGIFIFEVVSAAVVVKVSLQKAASKSVLVVAAIRTALFHFVAIAKENNHGRTTSGFRPCPAA